jgi:catechol 2,3-dioxygenase-like lactoylglutathione lyase family enzyme
MLRDVGAVLFHSEHPSRLVHFYQDVLGLTPAFGGEDGAEFRLGGVRIGLWQHSAIRGPARDPDRIILNFLVDDCAAAYQALRGKEVVFIKPPTDEDWGGRGVRLATFRDPDGNLLQLLEFRR